MLLLLLFINNSEQEEYYININDIEICYIHILYMYRLNQNFAEIYI